VTVQTLINAGITIGSILIAGNCLQVQHITTHGLIFRNSYVFP
jgi:hypothetical protein